MRLVLLIGLLLTIVATHAGPNGTSVAMGTWEPRNWTTVAGLVLHVNTGCGGSVTLNGSGVSQLADRLGTNHLNQATASAQPIISRADNKSNLLLQSETFQTTWTRTRINAFGADDSGNAGAGSFANTSRTLDPVGGNNADFIQEDATAANDHILWQSGLALTGGVNYTFSVWLKAAGRIWARITVSDSAFNERFWSYIRLDTGVLGAGGNSGSAATFVSASIESSNGWYRLSVTGRLATSANTHRVYIQIAEADNDITFDGDNTSGLFLYGASLRPAAADSDYIVTTTVPAYRGQNGRKIARFDGTDDYLKSSAFTLNQPTTVIWVGMQETWTSGDVFFDGETALSLALLQSASGVSPSLWLNAGASVANNTNLALNTFGVSVGVFNGASSSLTINNTAATTGNPGLANAGGFTLGARGSIGAWSNQRTADVLISNKDLSLAANTNILSYLVYGGRKITGAW